MEAERKIRKHVAIIHAYSKMTHMQRKVVNVLLFETVKNYNPLEYNERVVVESQIHFQTLAKDIKFTSNNQQYLKDAVDELASVNLEWNLLKDRVPKEISFINLRILHGAPTFYHDNIIKFSFHKILIDLVHNPSMYGTIDMDIQSMFDSKYAHSLYENCTRCVNLEKNKVIQLDVFRKMLGISNGKYSTMREFSRNVITPAIEEVNDRANFYVKLQQIKSGKKVVGFELSAEAKEKAVKNLKNIVSLNKERARKEIAINFGEIASHVLDSILSNEKYTEEYILSKIEYVKNATNKQSNGFFPTPYFIAALRDNYTLFKDQNVPASSNTVELLTKNDEWKSRLQHLQANLSHYRRILELMNGNDEHAKKMIVKCEEEIKLHLEKKVNN